MPPRGTRRSWSRTRQWRCRPRRRCSSSSPSTKNQTAAPARYLEQYERNINQQPQPHADQCNCRHALHHTPTQYKTSSRTHWRLTKFRYHPHHIMHLFLYWHLFNLHLLLLNITHSTPNKYYLSQPCTKRCVLWQNTMETRITTTTQ